jgi:hypothetical protein
MTIAERLIAKHPGHAPLVRFIEAYLEMADKANYRPGAPNDGWGNIVGLTVEELKDRERLEMEALEYAICFQAEENSANFLIRIGTSNYITNKAFFWSIEAARCLSAGIANDVALKLLQMATDEVGNQMRSARRTNGQ